ncbi:patatin-like phospholipase family protein [Patescibacteria group bacterium]|nr:patatin-like phospholipase family protein [Patescibacteria group bacterium]
MRNLGKVGVIFTGGGLAGCYSMGFAKALAEKGITADYVQGVSVGALTAAKLMSTEWSIEETEKLWLRIQELGSDSLFNKWDWKKVVWLPPAVYDERHIWDLIIDPIDCGKVVESPIKFHIVANNRNKKRFVAFSNHNMEVRKDPSRIKKILQATTGLYGFLPSVCIDGDWYGDGMSFMLNEALKARCDTIFVLMNDQFSATSHNYGEPSFLKQFISGFRDCVLQLDTREIKYARGRGYDIIENNPSGHFDDANPLHKTLHRRIRHFADGLREAATNVEAKDAFVPHRIVVLTPPKPIPSLHTLGFKQANPKTGYPGDISLAIEQCSKLPDEFWEKI